MESRSNSQSMYDIMFGMKAMPYIWDLARQADKAIPYVPTALKVVPFTRAWIRGIGHGNRWPIRRVAMGLQAAPYIANAASHIAQNVDKVFFPFGSFGDLTTTSRYKAAEQAWKGNLTLILQEQSETA